MVLPVLDGFFGNVATVIVWKNDLEINVGGFDIFLVEGRYFVFGDLVILGKCLGPSYN